MVDARAQGLQNSYNTVCMVLKRFIVWPRTCPMTGSKTTQGEILSSGLLSNPEAIQFPPTGPVDRKRARAVSTGNKTAHKATRCSSGNSLFLEDHVAANVPR